MLKVLRKEKGFTLTEIISVLGLTLLVTMLIYNIFLISQESFGVGDRHLEISQNGRVFLDRLSRELRQTQEIVTSLPETKDVEGFPPAEELEFQDGHNISDIQYIRYYQDNGQIKRQEKYYYFFSEPDTHVYWNSEDELGGNPESLVTEERPIAEYINGLNFYGSSITYIDVRLAKQDSLLHIFTGVWGRNPRL